MGDRGSISVINSGANYPPIMSEGIPVLFRYWGGSLEAMRQLADALRSALPADMKDSDPYAARDPASCMALLVHIAVEQDGYSAYLGKTTDDGDNSDNGHYVLDLATWEIEHTG